MTGYSFTTPVWQGGAWVTPVVAEVVAAPKANGPEDQPQISGKDCASEVKCRASG